MVTSKHKSTWVRELVERNQEIQKRFPRQSKAKVIGPSAALFRRLRRGSYGSHFPCVQLTAFVRNVLAATEKLRKHEPATGDIEYAQTVHTSHCGRLADTASLGCAIVLTALTHTARGL